MDEKFTIEYTGNNTDDLTLYQNYDMLGEYIYVGMLSVDGSPHGVLYAQKEYNDDFEDNFRGFRGAVHKDYEHQEGWIGKVILVIMNCKTRKIIIR